MDNARTLRHVTRWQRCPASHPTDTAPSMRGGTCFLAAAAFLFAQPFDLTGTPSARRAISRRRAIHLSVQRSRVAVGVARRLAYRRAVPGDRRQLVWFNRRGERVGGLGEIDGNRCSPNLHTTNVGRRSAAERLVAIGRGRRLQIWRARGWTRVDIRWIKRSQKPVWSVDGTRSWRWWERIVQGAISLSPSRPGGVDTPARGIARRSRGPPTGRRTATICCSRRRTSASRRHLVGHSRSRKAFPCCSNQAPTKTTPSFLLTGSGSLPVESVWPLRDIHCSDLARMLSHVQVSDAGGAQVRWRKNGRELFYIDLQGQLTAVPVTLPTGTGAAGDRSPRTTVQGPSSRGHHPTRRRRVSSPVVRRWRAVSGEHDSARRDTSLRLSLIFHWRADGRARIAP